MRIRTLLVAFVVLAAAIATLSTTTIRPYFDRDAMRQLESLGARVRANSLNGDSMKTPSNREVTSIELNSDDMIVEGASSLDKLPNLSSIVLLPGVTDHGLHVLSRLNLPRGASLDVIETRVTAKGLKALPNCLWLSTLFVNDGTLSSKAVTAIAECRQVTVLGLINEGRRSQPKISNSAMRAVADMTQLEKLTIIGLDVTDDGLRALSNLKNLRSLVLRRTPVSRQSIRDLEASLPNCTVSSE